MTDAISFYRNAISNVTQFINAFEQLQLLSQRISADSSLSGQAATAAQAGGRSDLSTADFDNLNNAIKSIQTRLTTNDATVNSTTVQLPFYKLM